MGRSEGFALAATVRQGNESSAFRPRQISHPWKDIKHHDASRRTQILQPVAPGPVDPALSLSWSRSRPGRYAGFFLSFRALGGGRFAVTPEFIDATGVRPAIIWQADGPGTIALAGAGLPATLESLFVAYRID